MQQIIPNSKFSFLKILVIHSYQFLLFYYVYESLPWGLTGEKKDLKSESKLILC